jgi:hypothetical protein
MTYPTVRMRRMRQNEAVRHPRNAPPPASWCSCPRLPGREVTRPIASMPGGADVGRSHRGRVP